MRARFFWIFCALGYSILALVTRFEASMINNILIGYPLLAYCGWQLAANLKVEHHWLNKLVNFKGLTGIILATFALAFWMIPNWMELAVSDPEIQFIKHLSIFTLVGIPLGLSWPQSNFVIRGFVKIELLSMLLRLGWVYLISPKRLCNIYSLSEQILLGKALLSVALILTFYYLYPLFVDQNKEDKISYKPINNR